MGFSLESRPSLIDLSFGILLENFLLDVYIQYVSCVFGVVETEEV